MPPVSGSFGGLGRQVVGWKCSKRVRVDVRAKKDLRRCRVGLPSGSVDEERAVEIVI